MLFQGGHGSVLFRFVRGTGRVVPVFGLDGSSVKSFLFPVTSISQESAVPVSAPGNLLSEKEGVVGLGAGNRHD